MAIKLSHSFQAEITPAKLAYWRAIMDRAAKRGDTKVVAYWAAIIGAAERQGSGELKI